MTKDQYLINKGRIPNPVNGAMWVVTSTRNTTEIKLLPIWKVEISGHEINEDGEKGRQIKKYHFHEAPYELDIIDGEISGSEEGQGSGFGDLWSWTHFGTFDEAVARKYYKEETIRVQTTYGLMYF